jgi:hypothetical protein
LPALGFQIRHLNQQYNGGWKEYSKRVEDLPKTHIKITTAGDGYSDDFMVWLECDTDQIAMRHIRTINQLRSFWQLVTGQEL